MKPISAVLSRSLTQCSETSPTVVPEARSTAAAVSQSSSCAHADADATNRFSRKARVSSAENGSP